ncbi:MAG: excinuclease ABC subunit A, partial [Alphaproteobacteria bacterium CG_4_10_14_0_8_um_filter_53_9]
TAPCPTCKGARFNEAALSVFLPTTAATPHYKKLNLNHFSQLPITQALEAAKGWQQTLTGSAAVIATPILREVTARLGFLNHVGLGYLNLARTAGTLSGGESQRIRLASQIGSGLTGVLYVLDEPSIGLHQRDNARLLESLRNLRDLDNTVLVVEHDEDAIRTADWVLDIGPFAGEHGGEIIAQGKIEDILSAKNSLTADYLTGRKSIPVPTKRRTTSPQRQLTVHNASGNNLKNLTVSFPLGVLTCITGVSGSGKSTLVMDTLHNALAVKLNGSRAMPTPHSHISGEKDVDKLVNIDQSPIGRTPRSNPATYTGVFGPIRDWFAALPDAKARGYGPGRFSFNVKGGRCEACQGDGLIKVDMQFMPDVYVECEVCRGKRFNRETLEIHHQGKSIADVLSMTVDEGYAFFKNLAPIARKLKTLQEVGLGYIRLGQSATTLSGGEAQRIKLAKELATRSTGNTLYILDEPTTGLHFHDIAQLLKTLHKLVDGGNTMLIIEHNLDVIKTADWVIDIGPEGGNAGGQLVAEGTPEAIAKSKASITGHYLAPLLKKKAAPQAA